MGGSAQRERPNPEQGHQPAGTRSLRPHPPAYRIPAARGPARQCCQPNIQGPVTAVATMSSVHKGRSSAKPRHVSTDDSNLVAYPPQCRMDPEWPYVFQLENYLAAGPLRRQAAPKPPANSLTGTCAQGPPDHPVSTVSRSRLRHVLISSSTLRPAFSPSRRALTPHSRRWTCTHPRVLCRRAKVPVRFIAPTWSSVLWHSVRFSAQPARRSSRRPTRPGRGTRAA
jgi:hypothetical protein